ncbi:MAG: hypothetical protein QM758_27060 [Armatimonas sp.]
MQMQRAPGQLALQKASFLYRRWEFQDWDGTHTLEYNGKGVGYESILLDGQEIRRTPSATTFVPRFDFPLQGQDTTLLIHIHPWPIATRLTIWQENNCLYNEGKQLPLTPAKDTSAIVYDKDGLIDQGPCVVYFMLSYRRRIIRSLWMALLSPLLLLMLLLPGYPPEMAVYLFIFSVVGSLLQALWNYAVFRNRQ